MSTFTKITHEFETPITLIMGPIQRMLHASTDPALVGKLDLMERNSKQLLSLVNQLMDFRKVEVGVITLNKSQGNIVELFQPIGYRYRTQQYLLHFIVSDVMIPKMNGSQFCRLVKNNLSVNG